MNKHDDWTTDASEGGIEDHPIHDQSIHRHAIHDHPTDDHLIHGHDGHADESRPGEPAARLKKSPSAFRTISEVADDLHIPQHVLRFWETRFPQVKPLKRGGGRRYYRPDDIGLLRRISDLLYIQGYTIKGVQRLLREGDGTLTGDLPPPEMVERDDEVLFPVKNAAPSVAGLASVHSEPTPGPDPHALADENRRLRGVLRTLLGELEQLRTHFPA